MDLIGEPLVEFHQVGGAEDLLLALETLPSQIDEIALDLVYLVSILHLKLGRSVIVLHSLSIEDESTRVGLKLQRG